MENAIEIRHYVTRDGKDVFDEWLTDLADARAQAKIASRINRLAVGNFGDCKSLRHGLYELRIDLGRATESITRCPGEPTYCFCAEAINGDSRGTLNERCGTSKTTVKGP